MMINSTFIKKYSERYQYNYVRTDEALEEEIRKQIGECQTCLSAELLYKILAWKAPRVKNLAKRNDTGLVGEVSRERLFCLRTRGLKLKF